MNTTARFVANQGRVGSLLLASMFFSVLVFIGCSRPSSSMDLTGNWIEPVDLGNNSYTTWTFKSDGTLVATQTLLGDAQEPEAGRYTIRSTHGKVPGDIIEVLLPKRQTPTLFRIPPNASTMIVRIDTDDDAFSADRAERRVVKAQPGQTGPSEAQRQSADGVNAEGIYKGKVVRVEPTKKGGFTLRLDTTIHDKKFECCIMDIDVSKFGDVTKLQGKRVEVNGKLEEVERTVILFLEDADQLKVLE